MIFATLGIVQSSLTMLSFIAKSNQKSCAEFKTRKDSNKSYYDLNSGKLTASLNI